MKKHKRVAAVKKTGESVQMSAAMQAAAALAPKPSEDKLIKLRAAIARARDLELEIEAKQTALDEKMKELTTIRTVELPGIFEEAQVSGTITLEAVGNEPAYEATLAKFYSASLPDDDRREKAFKRFKWLAELSKTRFTVDFGKGDDKKVKAFTKLLKAKKVEASSKVGVHSGTLTAEIRRRFESGKPLAPGDLDLLGATVGTVVKLNKVKGQKDNGK